MPIGIAIAAYASGLGAVLGLSTVWLDPVTAATAHHTLATVAVIALGLNLAGFLMCLAVVDSGCATPTKFLGETIGVQGLGRVRLVELLAKNAETEVYHSDHPGVVVKIFDLSCGRADEISYGPYMEFCLELANFEDLRNLEPLQDVLPRYYGANIDYEKKFALVAMEYLEGQDLTAWCEEGAREGYPDEWVEAFQETIYETLAIMRLFHKNGIILIDFKPDDILRLPDKTIKFVDLGAFFTPRQAKESEKYVYSTTPDHAELLIDSSNVPTGVPLTEASDIFSAGVALFEMATSGSRLVIDGPTADDILSHPELFRFRDSQIRGVWHSNPNLKEVLPLVETQLLERRLLFSEFWPLLKGYVASKMDGWDTLEKAQQDQIMLTTGTTFILEQIPPPLQWLAGPIAQATALRGLRPKTVTELMKLLERQIPDQVREDLDGFNCLVQFLRDLDPAATFSTRLNRWEARLNPATVHWAVATRAASLELADNAPFTFLKRTYSDEQGHRYYCIVEELDADDIDSGKLTVWQLKNDHFAWIG